LAKIVFPDNLLSTTQGTRETEVNAETVRDLLAELDARWPGCGKQLGRCAIAIDGQIYQDAFLESLKANSEVFFMPRIEGG
jgi:molybdopterin converting factor small subunit